MGGVPHEDAAHKRVLKGGMQDGMCIAYIAGGKPFIDQVVVKIVDYFLADVFQLIVPNLRDDLLTIKS